MSKIRIILPIAGFMFLGMLIYQTGPRSIWNNLVLLGWGFLLILPFSFMAWIFDTMGWKYTLPHKYHSIPFISLFLTRLAGEAVNNVTPTGYMGGEPVKAYLLKRFEIPLAEGLASVIIAKTIFLSALILFGFLGLAVAFFHFHLSQSFTLVALFSILWVGGGVLFFFVMQRKGLESSFLPIFRKLKISYFEERKEKFRAFDQWVKFFYKDNKDLFSLSLLYHFLGWIVNSGEEYLFFRFMGQNIALSTAIVMDALATMMANAAFFIPASLGAQEGGFMLMAMAFNIDTGLGLTFSIVRRIRDIFWSLLGLLILAIR